MYPVVTIGRQYGAGGSEIGKKLAQLLGVHFFDKELLALAAKESGIDYHVAGSVDEKPVGSFLYSIVTAGHHVGHTGFSSDNLAVNDRLYAAQKQVIERLAVSPCVIMGRCADSILKELPENIRIFIYAPVEYRARKIANEYGISFDKAKEKAVKSDKARATFYRSNTSDKWGDVRNYHLCIDASTMSAEKAAEIIADFVRSYVKTKENGK